MHTTIPTTAPKYTSFTATPHETHLDEPEDAPPVIVFTIEEPDSSDGEVSTESEFDDGLEDGVSDTGEPAEFKSNDQKGKGSKTVLDTLTDAAESGCSISLLGQSMRLGGGEESESDPDTVAKIQAGNLHLKTYEPFFEIVQEGEVIEVLLRGERVLRVVVGDGGRVSAWVISSEDCHVRFQSASLGE